MTVKLAAYLAVCHVTTMRCLVQWFPLAVAFLAIPIAGVIVHDASQISDVDYDYVLVGAGTAGCTLASRLSEDNTVRVLLIEAGVSDEGPESGLITIPGNGGLALGTRFDWNYTTVPQNGLEGRILPYPRGFVLGGSSSINSMVYIRGPRDDFNRISSLSGDDKWSWDNMIPLMLKDEQHVPAWSHRNEAGQYDPRVHGTGPLLTSLTGLPTDFDNRVINTTWQLKDDFPFNLDLNSGHGLGVGWMQSTVGNSMRSSSSSAFLKPALANRSNLDLLIETRVTRLIQTDLKKKAFRGVTVAKHPEAERKTITARREVILSAGSIGTPQLLLLSGIGDKKALTKLHIDPLVDLPHVGKNLQDQAILAVQFATNETTLSSTLNNATALAAAAAEYQLNKTGFLASSSLVDIIGFFRAENVKRVHQSDPSSGPKSPHFTLAFVNTFLPNPGQTPPTTGNWFSVAIVLQAPTSSGSVKLNSSSAFDRPIIDPGFLQTDWDISVMKEGIRKMQKFLSTRKWKAYISSPFQDAANLESDDDMESYVRKFSNTIYHPVGTSRIGKGRDASDVVGPDLKVRGTTGLRVVDASVLPFAPGGFPQAQVYLVAERAAKMIQSQHGKNG